MGFMEKNELGLIGLAVMGQNLSMNLADRGYKLAVYNRSSDKTDNFMAEAEKSAGSPGNLSAFYDLSGFVESLERPRRILLMVQAGAGVDAVIKNLVPLLESGDIIADLGNSFFEDSVRREKELSEKGIIFAGVGVSGGEEGARRGPSIMPGGSNEAARLLEPVFMKISAKVEEEDGSLSDCSRWIGGGGSGHFVKMVHNGIEYGDMQMIAEAYALMTSEKQSTDFRLGNDEAADIFTRWNGGDLAGFLNEITADILRFRDEDGNHLIDRILDAAGQKGTGKWTVEESFSLARPVTVISEAVYARSLSALKDQRMKAQQIIEPAPAADSLPAGSGEIISDIADALLASRIISYAQGFSLISAASESYGWRLKPAEIASIWRGGCIIRSALLGPITEAFSRSPELPSLLLDGHFADLMYKLQPGWRRTAARAMLWGVSIPAISSALAYFDGFRSGRVSANMIQAQRDYFGGHMYERTDAERGEFFHTNWTGRGGSTASTAYNA